MEEATKCCKFPRGVLVALVVVCLAGAALFVVRRVPGISFPFFTSSSPAVSSPQAAVLKKFSSVEEFKSYLEKAEVALSKKALPYDKVG